MNHDQLPTDRSGPEAPVLQAVPTLLLASCPPQGTSLLTLAQMGRLDRRYLFLSRVTPQVTLWGLLQDSAAQLSAHLTYCCGPLRLEADPRGQPECFLGRFLTEVLVTTHPAPPALPTLQAAPPLLDELVNWRTGRLLLLRPEHPAGRPRVCRQLNLNDRADRTELGWWRAAPPNGPWEAYAWRLTPQGGLDQRYGRVPWPPR